MKKVLIKLIYRRTLFILLIISVLISSGCSKLKLFGPTYPKNEIPSAIQRLCKQEYKITEKIDVKIAGKTLGVRLYLDNLLDINLKLQEKAVDKLQDLLRIIRRVCMSTDAKLDFYVIIGYEEKLGLEVVFYSYIDDLKKAISGWMSSDDYFQRLIKTMRMGTLRWGDNRIEKFKKDIESGNMVQVIVNNFATGTKLQNLSPLFLKILTDLGKKSYIRWHILKINSIPVGTEERLFYIEAKEYFTPILEEIEKLQYPSGAVHKFYILIETEDLNPVIKSIYTQDSLPEKYNKFGSPSTWNENDFFVEDLVFHEFLSTQIVQRIQQTLAENKKEEAPFTLNGDFIIKDNINTQVKLKDPSQNILKMTIKSKKGKTIEISQKIKDTILKTIKDVCNKYKFYDIGEVQLVDNKDNPLLVIDKLTLFE